MKYGGRVEFRLFAVNKETERCKQYLKIVTQNGKHDTGDTFDGRGSAGWLPEWSKGLPSIYAELKKLMGDAPKKYQKACRLFE